MDTVHSKSTLLHLLGEAYSELRMYIVQSKSIMYLLKRIEHVHRTILRIYAALPGPRKLILVIHRNFRRKMS